MPKSKRSTRHGKRGGAPIPPTPHSVPAWSLNVERLRMAGTLDSRLLQVRWTDASDLNLVKELLNAGANPNAIHPEHGWTPLLTACEAGHGPGAQMLIDGGADVNYRIHNENYDPVQDGLTALIVACQHPNIEMARLLVARGADVNAVMTGGMGALHFAVANANLELVKFLVESGADVDQARNGGPAPWLLAAGISHEGANQRAITEYLVAKSPAAQARLQQMPAEAQTSAVAPAETSAAAAPGPAAQGPAAARSPPGPSARSAPGPSARSAPGPSARSAPSGPVPSARSGAPRQPKPSWRKGGKKRFYTRKYTK